MMAEVCGLDDLENTLDYQDLHTQMEIPDQTPILKTIATKGEMAVESFGEATPENTKQNPPYYSAMAEKRALSRVVLKQCGAYKHGVYGEDEADDFKKENS